VESIQASRAVPYPRVLYALGIRHVGETVAEKLAEAFPTLDQLLAAPAEAIAAVYTLGDTIAQSVRAYLDDPENQAEIARLREAGLQFALRRPSRSQEGPLAGKRLLVTGTFPGVRREDLIAYIQAHGGTYASGISRNLDYLVVGEEAGPTKLQKAHQLGIRLLSLADLEALVGQPVPRTL